MQWKKTRTREEIAVWFFEVDTQLKAEGHRPQRMRDLRRSLSALDEPELLEHALWIISNIRTELTKGARVSDIREALGVARAILSFCGRLESGNLTPYVKE